MNEKIDVVYQSPPIIEAILGIAFASPPLQASIEKAAKKLGKNYTSSDIDIQVEAKIDFKTRSTQISEHPPIHKLSNNDQTESFSLGFSGASWIRRAPYLGWDNFFGRISREMPIVLENLRNSQISRVGLRYINRIDIPAEGEIIPYERYFNMRIDHGTILDPCDSFQWVVARFFREMNLKSVVQCSSTQPEIPNFASFTFDIDISRDIDPPQTSAGIVDLLPSMRDLKNEIFEAGITDAARDMYK